MKLRKPWGTQKQDIINLYRLIYAIAPNTLVNAISEYFNYQDIQQEEQAAWIKDKKIIYLAKPGRAKNSIKGYRPLSMCETDQGWFVPGRSTQHAIAVALKT